MEPSLLTLRPVRTILQLVLILVMELDLVVRRDWYFGDAAFDGSKVRKPGQTELNYSSDGTGTLGKQGLIMDRTMFHLVFAEGHSRSPYSEVNLPSRPQVCPSPSLSELLIVFLPGEALPPSQRKSLFSPDLYLSWMSLYLLSILHTWGQNLRLHPRLHCVVPAGGFDPSYSRWVHPKYPFFLPVKSPQPRLPRQVSRSPSTRTPSASTGLLFHPRAHVATT